jgi:hypothetical protein
MLASIQSLNNNFLELEDMKQNWNFMSPIFQSAMCVVVILDTFNTEERERLSKTIEDLSRNEADRIKSSS